ncbi:Ulp1 protease family [Forsythia ovata]|uniref:Ulp1 protease family n=1 Tax=Forsythia ovata TaxID=205694 RepID=A0ABD1WC51_9LAMI
MTPARSNSKSRRKNKNKRSNSKIKKKRSSRQIKIKNMKKKINIPIEQGEKVEPMEIQLNDGSKIESHPSATVLQSLAQHDVKSAEKVHASNFGPPDKEQQSTVHEQQSTDYSEPSVVKLDDRNNTPLANVDPVDQDADKSTTKRMKISSIESDSSLNTFEDDLVFSEEDLITIDKSAEQHRLDVRDIDAQFEAPDSPLSSRLCKGTPQQTNGGDCGIVITKYAEYIHQKKISTMPNPLDTKLARHNMAVQLYKYATEKPDIQ